jgi:hypothetical protein
MPNLNEDLRALPAFVDRDGYIFSVDYMLIVKTDYKRYIIDAWSFIDETLVVYNNHYHDDLYLDFSDVTDYVITRALK